MCETGEKRRETGEGRQEMGDRRQETGDGRQKMGDGSLTSYPENVALIIWWQILPIFKER